MMCSCPHDEWGGGVGEHGIYRHTCYVCVMYVVVDNAHFIFVYTIPMWCLLEDIQCTTMGIQLIPISLFIFILLV